MSFAEMKKNRANAISKLTAAADKLGGNNYEDNRFWSPTVDKAGNGYAVIRFLPAKAGQELPWVRYWDHGFKGPSGRWYIENSLTTIGQEDPVSQLNSKLWNSGREEDKEIARAQKRRLHYVANVLVVSDPANPANDGKVFLYKFGKKIFDKVVDIMQPQFEDEKPVNPFDFWEGADFKIKIRQVEGYRNYDKSEFAAAAPLLGGDDKKLEEIYAQLHDLQEFVDPKNYKSYAELSRKLQEVLGESANPLTTAEQTSLDESTPAPARKSAAAPAPREASNSSADESEDGSNGEGKEDTLSYFAKLAKED